MKAKKYHFYKKVSCGHHECTHDHSHSSSATKHDPLSPLFFTRPSGLFKEPRPGLAQKYGSDAYPAGNLDDLLELDLELDFLGITETDFHPAEESSTHIHGPHCSHSHGNQHTHSSTSIHFDASDETFGFDATEDVQPNGHVHGPGCTHSHSSQSTNNVGYFTRFMNWITGKHHPKTHHKKHGPDLQGTCFCGRGIAAFSQANSSNVEAAEHANHTPVEHALEGATTPSIFGIAVPAVFLPIKLFFDWKNYQKYKSLKIDAAKLEKTENKTSFAKVIKQRLSDLRHMVPTAIVFYPTFLASIAGHAFGIAKFIPKIAQGLISASVFGFIALAALSIKDGIREIRSKVKVLKSLKDIQNLDFQRQVRKEVIKDIVKAAVLKISSGILIIAGLTIPGAQIAGLVGIALAMLEPAKSLVKFIYHKVAHWFGKSHDHLHFSKSEKELCNDPQSRELEFKDLEAKINNPSTSKKDKHMLKELKEKLIHLEIENRIAA